MRQRSEAIVAPIEELPPRCWEVFILVKFDGLIHAEAAQRMGIAVKTVEKQVQLALRACLRWLDE
ncbi:MAG: sigma factor-like helix-turn-helix DNA-binding protein [Burkholderiaceae bacterium]